MKNASRRLISSIEELGKLYDFLNKEFFESALSKPVITIMPQERKSRGAKILGWFTEYEVWADKTGSSAYELNVTAEYADRSLLEIAETLLHEMSHQFACENDIDDCSRSGMYHNKKFARIASEHGLSVKKTEENGFSKTTLTAEAAQIINRFEFGEELIYRRSTMEREEVLDLIEKLIPEDTPDREIVIRDTYTGVCEGKLKITKTGIKPKSSSTRKYICPECGMSVRATRMVNLKCGDCNLTMQCSDEKVSEEKENSPLDI